MHFHVNSALFDLRYALTNHDLMFVLRPKQFT